MEWVEWTVSGATADDDGVCWGVANDIHLAAFPIAMLCGDGGVSEGARRETGTTEWSTLRGRLCCAVVERPRLSVHFKPIISAEPSTRPYSPTPSPLLLALFSFLFWLFDRYAGAFTRLR